MFKKSIDVLVVTLIMVLVLTSCAQLSEKFIPKKKKEPETGRRYKAVRTYDIKPNLDLYTKRYIFWKNWHRETMNVIRDSNQKKIQVSLEQEISNLLDMKRMLVDEKAEELQTYINEIIEVESKVKEERVTQGNRVRIKKKLQNAGRGIKRNFSYNEMRDFIRDDWGS
ncbi:MAG: hypothetical protein GF409_02395 [Candidatus Omnitrophica bacterium]|nr:hypothetical protein [Candidatus Omnitrophota bacterium]